MLVLLNTFLNNEVHGGEFWTTTNAVHASDIARCNAEEKRGGMRVKGGVREEEEDEEDKEEKKRRRLR